MKVFSFLLLTLFAFSAEARRIQTPEAYAKTLQIRGGGAIGPLDGDLAMQLSKTVTTAYIAGSASKFIAAQTGGGSTQVGDFVTSDLFQSQALITAIACAMHGLSATGFDDLKTLAGLAILGLFLRLDSSGFNVDTIKDNKVQTAVALALAFIAFVN